MDNHSPNSMRYLSVCSGMEAASVAWEPLGWKAVGFSEIEPFPCAILKHRFPTTPNYGSLTEYQQWPIEPGAADLLVGGTPCQSFSVAGLRKGMADPRGNLALTFLGLADRIKPRWIVWENVPGVLSSNGGRDFGAFLGALVELGYGFAYRVLDAQHFGVPQRRRRVFVVACLGDWRAAASVLFEPDCVRRHLEAGGKKRKGTAADAGSGVDESGKPIWRAGDQANAEHLIDKAGTVNCNKGSHGGIIGQPVSHWEGGDVHPTLNQSAKGSGGVGSFNQELFSQGGAYLVPGQPFSVAFGGAKLENTAPTIMANGGPNRHGEGSWSSTQFTGVIQPVPFRKAKRAQSTTDDETWVEGEVSNTLNNFDLGDTRTTHAVVEPVDPKIVQASELRLTGKITEQSVCPTLKAGTKSGDTEPLAVMPPMAVRRLTPEESEKLQGFKPGWSRIPWKGKPEEDCPDGPRYKACGNSMAVPVMRWIGERIAQADKTFFPR
jgi:DNA (cytosine-5)-methyltransferase 1